MYSKEFIEFVENGIDQYFIGIGNPNAKILLVGKESAIPAHDLENRKIYAKNAEEWATHIRNNTCQGLEYEVGTGHELRAHWGKNTWSKYQQLSEAIWDQPSRGYYIDFLKYTFTTEMNDSPEKNTATADKSGLNDRKRLFRDAAFIQSFPVVVLACSNYIMNNDKIREIDDIFGVTYDGDQTGRYYYTKANWFYLHHNEDRSKLVVHTRQLSANVDGQMLKDMGQVIGLHLEKLGIK